MAGQGSSGNVVAAICNVFLPGLGQLIQGRFIPAVMFAIVCVSGYTFASLIAPAIMAGVFHLFSIIDAATYYRHVADTADNA